MGGAHGVIARLLQQPQLALLSLGHGPGPYHGVVVVDTAAIELGLAPVHSKAVPGADFNPADTHIHGIYVRLLALGLY